MKKTTEVLFKVARTAEEFQEGESLFRQYADSLQLDLSFQDFAYELKTIDQQYNAPKGALLIAYLEQKPIACVGIRELDSETAELKRMFVQPAYRGLRLGHKLLEHILSVAKELNYKKVRLDTLPTMTQAQQLYRSFGFSEISSYRFNPVEGTVFMEKDLG
jgi:GNAT superfamily N-acetyltransferase